MDANATQTAPRQGLLSRVFGRSANPAYGLAQRIAVQEVKKVRAENRSTFSRVSPLRPQDYSQAAKERISDLKQKASLVSTYDSHGTSKDSPNEIAHEKLSVESARSELKKAGITGKDIDHFADLKPDELRKISTNAGKHKGKRGWLFNTAALGVGLAVADQYFNGGAYRSQLTSAITGFDIPGFDIPSFETIAEKLPVLDTIKSLFTGAAGYASEAGNFVLNKAANGVDAFTSAATQIEFFGENVPLGVAQGAAVLGMLGTSAWLMNKTVQEQGSLAGLGLGIASIVGVHSLMDRTRKDRYWSGDPIVGNYAKLAVKAQNGEYGSAPFIALENN